VTSPRARFIMHNGKRIYLIDGEGLGPEAVIALCDQVEADVRSQPQGSVLTITNVKGVPMDHRLTDRLRRVAEGNRPYVKAAAITGLSPVQRFVVTTVKILARREFHLFDTVDQAKDFLAELE
jgi:hypothetical protein